MYLIPKPQHWEQQEGNYRILYSGRITMDANSSADLLFSAKKLQEAVLKYAGMNLQIDRQVKNTFGGITLRVCEEVGKEHGEETYELKIDGDGVCITGASVAGVLYGVQTFTQVLLQKGSIVPYMTIVDYPDLAFRGFYYDVTRGRIPTLEYLKKMADRLCTYKINQMQIYVEHSFLFKEFSEVWRDDTPLTSEDILELDAYCRERNIDLVPSVASFGHLYKVLRTKTMSEFCECTERETEKGKYSLMRRMQQHTVNVSNPGSIEMIKRMLAEYIPLFTSSKFNICCDETFDLGKEKSAHLKEKYGADRLYVDYLKEICAFVGSYDKQIMFWGDIILNAPETIKELPKDIICLTWDYGTEEGDTSVRTIWEQGALQYLCSGIHSWGRFVNNYDMAYKNIKKLIGLAHQFDVIGLLNTCWGDYGHVTDSDTHIIGMIYGAAGAWNKDIVPQEELNAAISRIEYGDLTEKFASIVDEISCKYAFSWNEFDQYYEMLLRHGNQCRSEGFWRNIYLFNTEYNIRHINELNAQVDDACERLSALLPTMNPEYREHVHTYLVLADGQKLVSLVCAVIDQYVYGHQNDAVMNPKELASKLEWWLLEYKKLWRKTCQESELHRISEIFYWFADYLREFNVE